MKMVEEMENHNHEEIDDHEDQDQDDDAEDNTEVIESMSLDEQ